MWQSIKSSAVTGIECRLSSQECDRLIEAKAAEDERNSQLLVELEQVKKVANDQAQLAAKQHKEIQQLLEVNREQRQLAEKYRRMLDGARDAYIKEHSDGETDCVTPYDVYDVMAPLPEVVQLQTELKALREAVIWYDETAGSLLNGDARYKMFWVARHGSDL